MIGSYYKTITACPLTVFIAVLVSNDLKKLVRWGYPTKKALAGAWDDMFDEYLRENNSATYAIILRRMKDLAISKNKIRLALGAVQNLGLRHSQTLVECLRLLGYRYKFDPTDAEGYARDLKRVQTDIKNLITTTKEAEEKLKGDSKNEVKETDFDALLVELGRFQGYRIDKNQVTVSEFLQMLKNYKTINTKKDGKQRKN